MFSKRQQAIIIALLSAFMHHAPTVFADDASAQQSADNTIVETVLRLPGFDIQSSEKAKAAVVRFCRANAGGQRFFELVERFELPELNAQLLELVIAKSTDSEGAHAAKLLLSREDGRMLHESLENSDDETATKMLTALRLARDPRAAECLLPLVADMKRSAGVRAAAAMAIGATRPGEQKLLELVQDNRLPSDLNFVVTNVLHASKDASIRETIAKLIPLPETKDSKPLPPLAALVKMRGDASRGKAIFFEKGTCAKCHQVGEEGKQVGPALTEIGSKLAKDAMYVSILDPSAGISHNFESYAIALDDGTIASGVLVSETDDSITIKNAEAIEQTFSKDEVEQFKKQTTSLMPSDLQKLLTAEELADLVEYLMTLKKM